MSYLKTFETFHYSNLHRPDIIKIKVDELKDLCETYLAYLMDDCIKELKCWLTNTYSSITRGSTTKYIIQTEKYVCYDVEIYFNKSVQWDQIKDHFLPFLQMVQKEYGFREYKSGKMCSIAWRIEDSSATIPKQYTLKELLSDRIETNFKHPYHWQLQNINGATNVGSIKLEILEEVSKD